jgi:hypothetical protein
LDIRWKFKHSKVLASAGTQTAALAFGGNTPLFTGATEEYDGTSWTNYLQVSTARYSLAGAGTQTAALAFGGDTPGTWSQQQQKNGQVQEHH